MADRIRIKDVAKTFLTRGRPLLVVEGIDLAVAETEFVALVGPSGCGKTTLLNIIAGFEAPDRGEVSVDGMPVTGPSRTGIVISQLGSVFPWLTVAGNLTFGLGDLPRAERARVARHYLAVVGLQGFEHAFPSELSGGMLKRVEVARALAVRPEILYMDEPFAALDALTRLRLRLELRRILAEEPRTCVLVTHDVEEAIHLADRIVVLSARPGRIQDVVDIPFPHPRRLSSLEVVALKDRILRELGVEALTSGAD